MKRVYSSFDLAAVHHAKNLLDCAGIRAVVKNEFLGSAMGELPPAECQPELWLVNDADGERAEALLYRRAEPSADGNDWSCGCGERLGGQFTQCWRCGACRSAEGR